MEINCETSHLKEKQRSRNDVDEEGRSRNDEEGRSKNDVGEEGRSSDDPRRGAEKRRRQPTARSREAATTTHGEE
ncbi:hypothetical protein AHAS_Ahas09G0087900 [Arachis hypogaea]